MPRAEITLNVGMKLFRITFVAPKEVILKHELYIWILSKKCFDCGVVPEINVANGSGGYCNSGNLTLPLAQHIPGVSL